MPVELLLRSGLAPGWLGGDMLRSPPLGDVELECCEGDDLLDDGMVTDPGPVVPPPLVSSEYFFSWPLFVLFDDFSALPPPPPPLFCSILPAPDDLLPAVVGELPEESPLFVLPFLEPLPPPPPPEPLLLFDEPLLLPLPAVIVAAPEALLLLFIEEELVVVVVFIGTELSSSIASHALHHQSMQVAT